MAREKKQEILTLEERLQAALVPESEQPYPVPENWCWVYAPSMFNIEYGKGLPTKKLCEDGYPVFGANGQIGFYNEYMFEDEKALMSCRGAYSGTMNLSLPKSFITNNSLVIESKLADVGVKFVFYLYSALNKANLISGSAQPQVTVQAFNNYPVPIPPLHEQQRIVNRIESLFAKLDEAKQKAQDALDSFETRKAAILHKAFNGELTAQWRKEHGVGMESWKEKTINDIGDVKGGKRIPKGMELTYENTGHPYLKAGNLKQGTVIASGMMYVTDEILECIKNYTVSAGDVYITNVGACIGDCGIIPPEYDGANLTENAVKITNLKCNNKWLSYYLSGSSVQHNIKSMIASATLGKLSIANIKKIELNIPTLLDEQIEIVRILDNLFAKEQQAKEAAEGVLEQIDLIKKSILARAFRGELGTNDPREESAVELLKQVL